MRWILNSGLTHLEKTQTNKLWEWLANEVDYTVKISFRIHRLEFSNIKQGNEELIKQYVSRLREKATKFLFEQEELNERLIETFISSTQNEEFRKELLTKPKGMQINNIIERGREHKAVIASIIKSHESNLWCDTRYYNKSRHNETRTKPANEKENMSKLQSNTRTKSQQRFVPRMRQHGTQAKILPKKQNNTNSKKERQFWPTKKRKWPEQNKLQWRNQFQ